MKTDKLIAAAALATALLFWAAAFPAIQQALESYSPQHLAVFRFLIASLASACLALRFRPAWPRRRDWPLFAAAGVFGILGYTVALNFAEETIRAASASFIVGLSPILTALLAPTLLGEPTPRHSWMGLLIAFAGVAFISLGEETHAHLSAGILWALIAMLCGTVIILAQKPLLHHYDGFTVSAWSIWIGTALMLVFFSRGLFAAVRTAHAGPTAAVIYLGIFPGAIAYLTWAVALAKLSAARAASFLLLVPVLTLVISFIWLGEMPSPAALLGGGMTLVGLFIGHDRSPSGVN